MCISADLITKTIPYIIVHHRRSMIHEPLKILSCITLTVCLSFLFKYLTYFTRQEHYLGCFPCMLHNVIMSCGHNVTVLNTNNTIHTTTTIYIWKDVSNAKNVVALCHSYYSYSQCCMCCTLCKWTVL